MWWVGDEPDGARSFIRVSLASFFPALTPWLLPFTTTTRATSYYTLFRARELMK